MKLYRVRSGFYLHWPKEIEGDSTKKLWLGPGGVIDLDDTFVARLVVGQEYKLEAEDRATAPTDTGHGRFQLLQRQHNANLGQEAAAKAAPAVASDPTIPKPDVRPKKEEKKHGTLSGAVSQSDSR